MPVLRLFKICLRLMVLPVILGLPATLLAEGVRATSAAFKDAPWRLRLLEAAVVEGPLIRLGEIARPAGPMPEDIWQALAGRELWPAPEEKTPPLNLTRPRLQQAILNSLGRELAALCLYPPSLTLQRGGRLLDEADVQELTVKTLTTLLTTLPGESSFSDFRLPTQIFLADKSQYLELEAPAAISPGRLSLRYVVREADGGASRRLTGSVFVDCWATVPCLSKAANKGEVIRPEHVSFVRKNLAYLRETPWDGRGGPWQAQRAIFADQAILESDLGYVPTVKKGDLLRLVFESPSVRLSATVEALADGVGGEAIPVRNVRSKRQIYAFVLDAQTVLARSGQTYDGRAPTTPQPEKTLTEKRL
ncbi:MAG: flagellar basal body P-ring formation chaperone FlgA [Deltaproteobacteria bacterium]|jgi:flagella basal body P-ring formation protein FlgA|nr:flagellar basal body P-ring formation chaperone FlgA [Deltaproteobacteria bacterium]